jgi:transposase-like protein
MLKDDRIIKRYSESFKLKVLDELSTGKFTKAQIIRNYSIGCGTLENWIKKYGRFDLFNKRIKIETMDEKDKIKSLKEEISKLKELLVKKDLDNIVNEAYLEYAAKQLGFKSIEELKKKLDLK